MKRLLNSLQGNPSVKDNFINVLHSSKYLQVVLLNIKPGAKIGLESNGSVDQFFGFKGGEGKCTIEGQEFAVGNGDVIIIPAGSENDITKFKFHKKVI
jgi:mannose-6-phosphate isomerase-like protein (cupin superfamily)